MGIGAAIVGALKLTGFIATIGAIAIEAGISLVANKLTRSKRSSSTLKDAGRTGNVRSTTQPHEVIYGRVRKGGMIAYINGTGSDNIYLHLVIMAASHKIRGFNQIYFDGQYVAFDTSGDAMGQYSTFARIQERYGDENQLALADMVSENDNWTADHRLAGRAYIYMRLKYNPELYTTFIPKITAEIEGMNSVYDPRVPGFVYTENPALICADILVRYLGVPRSRIDLDTLVASADICDQLVNSVTGAIEKRYSAGGYFLLDGSVEDWLSGPIQSMAGGIIEFGGIYYIHAGAWSAADVTITDDDIVGSIQLETARSDSERANVATGTFVAAQSFDQPSDFPVVKDTAAILEDGGVENELTLDLEWVTSAAQAQRVAKILLNENRLDETIAIEVSLLKGLDVKPWDNITLESSVLGISGTYKVISHVIDIGNGDDPVVIVKLGLKKHNENVYAWDYLTEEKIFTASETVIPGGADLPKIVDYTVAKKTSSMGNLDLGTATMTVAPSFRSFDNYEIQFIVCYEHRAAGSNDAWQVGCLTKTATKPVAPRTFDIALTDTNDLGDFEYLNIVVERVKLRLSFPGGTSSAWVEEINQDKKARPVSFSYRPSSTPGYWLVNLSTPEDGAEIRYTYANYPPPGNVNEGATPTKFIIVEQFQGINARAFKAGKLPSDVSMITLPAYSTD